MEILHRRIGRLGYAAGLVISTALILPLILADKASLSLTDRPKEAVSILLYAAFNILISAWRCHDFGKSGWHDFWNNQIPFVGGLISFFELLFKPGDPHMNSFGKPPWV
jgi:uncharacterized membrane protein YhaH (DUF805 family)